MEKKFQYLNPSPNPLADIKIESLLTYSVTLFKNTGMPDLANKWQKILENYRGAVNQRESKRDF